MTAPDDSGVRLEVSGNRATVVLNRPSALNALDARCAHALATAVARCREDDAVGVVILRGAGRAFCAGGDMKAAAAHLAAGGDPRQFFLDLTVPLHRAVTDLRAMAKPVIAAIGGVAAGAGMSLALACDYRIGGTQARFKQAYTSMGLAPDGGWTAIVPFIVGSARTQTLLLLDPVVEAPEALEIGFIHEVVDDPLERAAELAGQLVTHTAGAFGAAKQLLNAALAPALEAQLERERQAIAAQGASEEFSQRLQHFVG